MKKITNTCLSSLFVLNLIGCRAEQSTEAESASYGNQTSAGGTSYLKNLAQSSSTKNEAELITIALMLNNMHSELNTEATSGVASQTIKEALYTATGIIAGGAAAVLLAPALTSGSILIALTGVTFYGGQVTFLALSHYYLPGTDGFKDLDKKVTKLISDMKSLEDRFKDIWNSSTAAQQSRYLAAAEKYLNYGKLSLSHKSFNIGYFYRFNYMKNQSNQVLSNGTVNSNSGSTSTNSTTSSSGCATANKRIVTYPGAPEYRNFSSEVFTTATSSTVAFTLRGCFSVCLISKTNTRAKIQLKDGQQGYIEKNHLSLVNDAYGGCDNGKFSQ